MARIPSVPFDTSVPVLVLQVGNYPLHHGSLGVIRSLGRVGVPVYALHEGQFTPPATSRYLSGGFTWNSNGLGDEELLDGLLRMAERIGRRAILVPTDDTAAIFITEHGLELNHCFLFPQQPPALPRSIASKRSLQQLCRRLHVACPRAVVPSSWADVDEFVERAAFPVVVKGAEPWLLPKGAGVLSTTIVRTPEELVDLYGKVADWPDTTLLFQEYIPPEVGEDWFFHGYCNARSECLVGCTGRKLRSYPAHAGSTSLGVWAANGTLHRQAEELLRATSYRGITDLDYRLDRRDGQYKLLDFNPRLGAQFRLFEDDAGIDVVRALHLDLTGRPVPRGRPIPGRAFIVERRDLLASWQYRRSGRLTLCGWLRSLRGVRELAWFSTDDPIPFLVMCARFLLARMGHIRANKRGPALAPDRRLTGPQYTSGRRRRTVLATGKPERRLQRRLRANKRGERPC